MISFLKKSYLPEPDSVYRIGILDCFYYASKLFIDTFFLAKIFSVSNENIVKIGIYNAVAQSMIFTMGYLLRPICNSPYIVHLYRSGIFINIIFFIIALNLSDQSFQPIIFGVLFGLSTCLRAYARQILITRNVKDSQQIQYCGYVETVKSITRIIMPAVLGVLLTFYSFSFVCILFILWLSIEFLLSLPLKNPNETDSKKSNFKAIAHAIRKNSLLRDFFLMEICRGFSMLGILPTTITIYIFYLFQTNLNLGLMTSFFALLMLTVNFLFGRYGKYGQFVHMLMISGILAVLTSLIFVFLPNRLTFTLYNLSFVTAVQILWLITNVNTYNVAKDPSMKHIGKTEFFIIRETCLGIGKLVGTGLFILIGLTRHFDYLKYLLCLLTLGCALMDIFAVTLNRKLNHEK